jgi:sec-independent protein translocase protein TatA
MSMQMAALSNLFGADMLIIILIIVVLFGSAKIPQLMRGLGSGINEFKKGLKEGEGGPEQKPAEAPKPAEAAKPAEAKPPGDKPPGTT